MGRSRDLRSWIEKLEVEGEFRRVTVKVDCDGEIQEIARRMVAQGGMKATGGPAVLFENIEGHEHTWCKKLFVGSMNNLGRFALMLSLPKTTALPVLVQKLRETLRNPIEPIPVQTGPVKENIVRGEGIDLYEIPVPLWHPLDGGRYINTWGGIVTKDPESGAYNVGCYRGMITDKNRISVLLIPSQGWGIHYGKYQALGKPMPVACVYGWDPSLVFTASNPVTTISEYEWMGSIMQEAVPLVKCETIDLEVPASAEIVVEGTISPDPATYDIEGPFKDVSGAYSEAKKKPVIDVSCITYRNDPLYTGTATGITPVPEEQLLVTAVGTAPILLNALEDEGVPGVLEITLAPFLCVKIRKAFQGHAKQVAAALFGHKALSFPFKVLIVVEEDVNIHDPAAVIRAINENADPARDVYVFPMERAIVDRSLPPEALDEDQYGIGLGSKLLIDATVNWAAHPKRGEWGMKRVPPKDSPPPEMVEKVKKRWEEYGF